MRMCPAGPMLCLKPANEANGTCVARFGNATQLKALCAALTLRPQIIDSQLLEQDHADVRVRPGRPPQRYVVEPFITTDR